MKREIKFRAIEVSSGEWVYGNFIHSKRFLGCGNEFRIHNQEVGLESNIDIDTLGEFTSLKDKNGVEIYEGDICKIIDSLNPDCNSGSITVAFKNGTFNISDYYGGNEGYSKWFSLEVVGNIHE